jgi:hypothetical protein
MSQMKWLSGVVAMALLAAPVLAQEGPPPPPGDDQRPARPAPPPRPEDGRRMMPGMMMRGGEHMPPEMMKVEMLRGYIELVDHFSRLAHDPGASGVAAVITAGEMLKARGTDAAIDYFTKVLPEVKDPTIQRAIRLQLADLYKTSGQQDKALEQLRILMTGGAPSAPAAGS